MKYALVRNNVVDTVLIANPEQKVELETALGAELIDANEYGLAVGDFLVGGSWTRNMEGEQVPVVKIPNIEERIDDVESALIELAILVGGVE